MVFGNHGAFSIHGLAQQVHDTPERRLADGDGDGRAHVAHLGVANQPDGRVHRDGSHAAVAQMLGHLKDEVERFVVQQRIRGFQRMEEPWAVAVRELHIHHRAQHLDDAAAIHTLRFFVSHNNL